MSQIETNSFELLIFGATRNTGLLIAEEALKKKLSVAVMVRKESDTEQLEKLGITILKGDAFELESCKSVFKRAQPKWVVSVLGGKNAEGRRVDAEGNINVIHAAADCASINRFLLMTSMGSGDQYEGVSDQVKTFLGEALRAKTLAENELQNSSLPWTILRPGGLNHNAATGDYNLLKESSPLYEGYVSRADTATATLELLGSEAALHQIFTLQGKKKENT